MKHTADTLTLKEAGKRIFVQHVYEPIQSEALGAILEMIKCERMGDSVDKSLLKSVVRVFSSQSDSNRDAYQRDLEVPFLEASRLWCVPLAAAEPPSPPRSLLERSARSSTPFSFAPFFPPCALPLPPGARAGTRPRAAGGLTRWTSLRTCAWRRARLRPRQTACPRQASLNSCPNCVPPLPCPIPDCRWSHPPHPARDLGAVPPPLH